MKNITVEDILNICNGKLICGDKKYNCENFCKDTRVLKNGDVYVGIKGEKFDGNTLYKQAIKNGAKVVPCYKGLRLMKVYNQRYNDSCVIIS